MFKVHTRALAGGGALVSPAPARKRRLTRWLTRLGLAVEAQHSTKTRSVDMTSPEWQQARRDVNRLLDARLRAGRDAAGLAQFPGGSHRPAGDFLDDRWLR